MLTEVLRFAVIGAASGGLYALLALGLVVVYRSSRVVNFSHAAIAVVAAYVFNDVRGDAALPLWLAVLVAVAVGAGIGLLIDLLVMRPLRRASPLTMAIASIGVLITLQGLLSLRYGANPAIVDPYLPTAPISIAGITVGTDRLLILLISLALTAGLYLMYRKTSFGLATSALAESRRSLAALGWSPTTVGLLNWGVAGGLAALAGILLAPIIGLTPMLALILVLPALAAALLGGLSSFPLTLAFFLGGWRVEIKERLDVATHDSLLGFHLVQ